jgi:DNA-nicking Smr family endonuclease
MAIQGRIDLHGLTRDAAHARLQEFLAASYARGHRCLLIITGKGAGVLRSEVRRILAEPPLSGIVLRFYPAQPRHGGDGAFYVLLRRARGDQGPA